MQKTGYVVLVCELGPAGEIISPPKEHDRGPTPSVLMKRAAHRGSNMLILAAHEVAYIFPVNGTFSGGYDKPVHMGMSIGGRGFPRWT